MSIADLLKPKWKHSDPDVRLKAVENMDASEQVELLREIAETDAAFHVRAAAVEKITDESLLKKWLDTLTDAELRNVVRNHLDTIHMTRFQAAADTDEALARLALIRDESQLFDIACETTNLDIRMAAAAKIETPERLRAITENNCGPKVGAAIVDRIDIPDLLEQIGETASSKKIKRMALEKLAVLRQAAEEAEVDPVDRELEALCRKLEALKTSGDAPLIFDTLRTADGDWQRLDPQGEHPLLERFETVQEQLRSHLFLLEKSGKAEQALSAVLKESEALAETPGDDTPKRLNKLKAAWDTADTAELAPNVRKDFDTRFGRACDAAEAAFRRHVKSEADRARRMERLTSLVRQVEKMAAAFSPDPTDESDETDEWPDLDDSLRNAAADDPEALAMIARYDAALEQREARRRQVAAEQRAAAATEEARLRELCDRVSAAVDAEDRAGLEQTVKAAQDEWKQLGAAAPEAKAALTDRFENACEQFFIRQREYWDHLEWERWANLNQKEDLCRVVELLNEQDIIQGAGQIVREARKKWRDIGAVTREKSEEIWQRFNTACDRVYERCLSRKQALFDELTAVVGAPDDDPESIQWNDAAAKVKALQQEWNEIGVLPMSVEKDLRDRFHADCNTFFMNLRKFYQQRDEQRQIHLDEKTRLCEAAERLADSEDWGTTAATLKGLQREWKTVGPVPKAEGDALWERFRTACDTFFERLKAREAINLTRKEALCDEAETLAAEATPDTADSVKRRLIELQQQWKAIGPVPADQADAVWQRFRKPCDAFFETHKARFEEMAAEQTENRERKEALAQQAEALAESGDWRETAETLKSLQQEWKTIGPAPRDAEHALWRRFRSACDTFFERRNAFFEDMNRQRRENLEKKEQLCLVLESMARLVMPDESPEPASPAEPAEQLSMALDLKNEILVPDNPKASRDRAIRKVLALQKEWKTIGPAPQQKEEALWQRFRSAADLFFTQRRDTDDQEKASDS